MRRPRHRCSRSSPACIAGPETVVDLATDRVDSEAELVVAIGRRAQHVPRPRPGTTIAGLMAGQDCRRRRPASGARHRKPSLGKSFPGSAQPGRGWSRSTSSAPATPIECLVNGERVQHASTAETLFPVDVLIEYISAITPMLPGDLLFTGTPPGSARTARRLVSSATATSS